MIAAIDASNIYACLFDHTRGFVAEHHRPHCDAPLALHDVVVRPAEADCCHTHQHLRRPGRIERDLLNRERLAGLSKYCGEAVHGQ